MRRRVRRLGCVAVASVGVFLFSVGSAAAQDEGVGVGVLGMLTRTTFRATSTTDFFNSGTGSGIGLWVGGNRNGRVGFTGEFIYLTRKNEDTGNRKYKYRVLEIPAVFHINVGSRSRDSVGGYGVIGPVFSINLKQERNGIDISEDFNGADIGLAVGGGVEFFRVGVEARGNWGLRNISSAGATSNTKTFTFEFLGKFAFN